MGMPATGAGAAALFRHACLTHISLAQVECADFVVCNKTDMLTDKAQLEQLISIIASLNPLSTVVPCEQGKVRAAAPQRGGRVSCEQGKVRAAAPQRGGGVSCEQGKVRLVTRRGRGITALRKQCRSMTAAPPHPSGAY